MSSFAQFVLAVWILGSLYWAFTCGYVAREKDRDFVSWGIAGFFIWILAFLPIAVVPDLTEYISDD